MRIKELERKLNEISECREDGLKFYVEQKDNEIILTANDNEENNLVYAVNTIIKEGETDLEIITNLISELYDTYINPNNRRIKKFKVFCDNKIKQLEKALKIEDALKVEYIQKELIRERKLVSGLKFDVQECKSYCIGTLYTIKNELEVA